ncbi:hypothetical protein BGW80DRAFT_734548 [Lactifluus volemus]|nr:hypothetical protein BGW80DRAFT_734548 [Lactifluus volemus]
MNQHHPDNAQRGAWRTSSAPRAPLSLDLIHKSITLVRLARSDGPVPTFSYLGSFTYTHIHTHTLIIVMIITIPHTMHTQRSLIPHLPSFSYELFLSSREDSDLLAFSFCRRLQYNNKTQLLFACRRFICFITVSVPGRSVSHAYSYNKFIVPHSSPL